MKKIATVLLIPLLWWGGCATKKPSRPVAALIVFKTPTIRYADQGFLYRNGHRIDVEVYVSGRSAFRLTVGKRICVDGRCMAEEAFYKRFFHTVYPRGTLAAILTRRPIFDGRELEKEGGQAVQRIKESGRFDIIYTFDPKTARFKDRLNHILVKITEIP